ncbi:MAG: HutP family protein, partial [Sporomusa sp.]
MKEVTSIDVGRAALRIAISETRQDEHDIRQQFAQQNMLAVAVDFGG